VGDHQRNAERSAHLRVGFRGSTVTVTARPNTGQIRRVVQDLPATSTSKREYNPQTGEELNIIGENTTDRPWYQRDYMRVDWSANQVESSNSFDPLAMLKAGGQELETLAYRVDPTDPDAPVFIPDEGYFDVTNKVYVKPKDIGGVPACFYYAAVVVGGSFPYGNLRFVGGEAAALVSAHCATRRNRATATMRPRNGTAHVSTHTARSPMIASGTTRHYGIVDAKWHHLIQRYNIWTRATSTYRARPSVDTDNGGKGDGTDDECAGGGAGSRLRRPRRSMHDSVRFAKHEPNAWHYNLNTDDEIIFDSTNHATEEWDTAVRLAVQAARRVECQRTGGSLPRWNPVGRNAVRQGISNRANGRRRGRECSAGQPVLEREGLQERRLRAGRSQFGSPRSTHHRPLPQPVRKGDDPCVAAKGS